MSPVFYIIEHDRRGTFRDMDIDFKDRKWVDVPRFSLSGMRNDADKAKRFRTVMQAQSMVKRIAVVNPKLGAEVKIRRSPSYHALCQECGRWTDKWHDHAETCSVYRDVVKSHRR